MVDSQFRHPKLAALLTLAGMVLALAALVGPRGSGVIGVGDASADGTPTSTTDPNYDDGVVFTVPAELGEVIVGPPSSAAPAQPPASTASAVAPTSTVQAASQAPPTTTRADARTDVDGDDEVAVPDEADVPDDTDEIVPVVIGDDTDETVAAVSLIDLPSMAGSARGGPAPDDVILGQLGTRDANSTPWMFLIGANFFVAGGALVALRLRR